MPLTIVREQDACETTLASVQNERQKVSHPQDHAVVLCTVSSNSLMTEQTLQPHLPNLNPSSPACRLGVGICPIQSGLGERFLTGVVRSHGLITYSPTCSNRTSGHQSRTLLAKTLRRFTAWMPLTRKIDHRRATEDTNWSSADR